MTILTRTKGVHVSDNIIAYVQNKRYKILKKGQIVIHMKIGRIQFKIPISSNKFQYLEDCMKVYFQIQNT